MEDSRYNLSFCKKLGYPKQLEGLIGRIAETIVEALDPASIILFGSTSRNEISCLIDNDHVDLLSDIEMIVVAENKRRIPAQLYTQLSSIEKNINMKNPLFHIDFGLATPRQLETAGHTIRTFDIKKEGKIIYGQNLLNVLPDVTAKTLDKSRTRELVLIRLANQLFYIPRRVVLGTPSEYESMFFRYVSARNILDIPTILLALNGTMLATYKDRVDFVRECFDLVKGAEIMQDSFVRHLEIALNIKRAPNLNVNPMEVYEWLIMDYERLLQCLCDSPLIEREDICDMILRHGLTFLKGKRKWKWKSYEALIAVKAFLNSRQQISLRWLWLKKREVCVCFLVCMHSSLLSYLSGDKKHSTEKLVMAMHFQDLLAIDGGLPQKIITDQKFAETWLGMRRKFIDQLGVIKRFPKHSIRNYVSVGEWTG